MIITRISDGKKWKVPEEITEFAKLITELELPENVSLGYTSKSLKTKAPEWYVSCLPFGGSSIYKFFPLDPSLYTITNENSVGREEIAKVLNEELRSLKDFETSSAYENVICARAEKKLIHKIASHFSIPLEAEGE